MAKDKIQKETEIWSLYEKGVEHHNKAQLYTKTDRAYRFYNGDQWHGLQSGGMELPVYNFIGSTVRYKVAMIAQNRMSLHYSPMEYGQRRDAMKEVCKKLNSYAVRQAELLKMDRLYWQVIKDGAIAGDSYLFFYDGEAHAQIIDNVNIYLGDEQMEDIQSQPYLMIAERRSVEEVRSIAKENGIPQAQIDQITADDDTGTQIGDEKDNEVKGGEGKCTSLLYMEKRDGFVTISRSVKQVTYQKATKIDNLSLYPIAAFVYNPQKNSARGQGEVAGLIANQLAVNKNLARRDESVKNNAFPILVYSRPRIKDPDKLSVAGARIAVDDNSVQSIKDAVSYITPAQMSADAKRLCDEMLSATRELAGAGDAATGTVDPTQASGAAIIAVRDQAAIPLNEHVAQFRQFVEEIAHIWYALWVAYHPNGMEITYEKEGKESTETIPPDLLSAMQVNIRVDVSPNNPFSHYAQEQALEKLYTKGAITFSEFVDALSENSTVPKGKLQDILRKREEHGTKQEKELPLDLAQTKAGGGQHVMSHL